MYISNRHVNLMFLVVKFFDDPVNCSYVRGCCCAHSVQGAVVNSLLYLNQMSLRCSGSHCDLSAVQNTKTQATCMLRQAERESPFFALRSFYNNYVSLLGTRLFTQYGAN